MTPIVFPSSFLLLRPASTPTLKSTESRTLPLHTKSEHGLGSGQGITRTECESQQSHIESGSGQVLDEVERKRGWIR
jgi:hypothetical protein